MSTIFTISQLSLPGKAVAFHLNKFESPLPKNVLCQVWPSGSGECENVQILQTEGQTDGQTDDIRSEKLTWTFSSGDPKTKCHKILIFIKLCTQSKKTK